MNDRERAAALVREITVKGLSWTPQGYRLDGPTEDIIVAALRAYRYVGSRPQARSCYCAMIAVAPATPLPAKTRDNDPMRETF